MNAESLELQAPEEESAPAQAEGATALPKTLRNQVVMALRFGGGNN